MIPNENHKPGFKALVVVTAVICTAALWTAINSFISDTEQIPAKSNAVDTDSHAAPHSVAQTKITNGGYVQDQYSSPELFEAAATEQGATGNSDAIIDPGDRVMRMEVRDAQIQTLIEDAENATEENAGRLSVKYDEVRTLQESDRMIW